MGAAYSNLVRTIALNSIRNELALSPLERLHFLLILCQANQHCLSLDLAWGLKDSSSSMINPRTLDCVVYSMVFVPILRNKKRQRRRKITWFNPPFSCNVATNIGREFLRILSKNFPLKHRYHKIFHRNTVKISYSCLPNMSSIIKSHNNKVIANSQKTIDMAKSDGKTCNCRKQAACPLEGNV